MNNLNSISPEIFISISIMFLLILGVFKKNSSNLIHYLSVSTLLVVGILILNNPLKNNISLFGGSYVIDHLSSFMKFLTILGGAIVLLISTKYLKLFKILNRPILAGLSRKSMIYKILKNNPEEALTGTISLNTIALINGANILRVHDVKEAKETIKLFNCLQENT